MKLKKQQTKNNELKTEGGFTLIEVLIYSLILAMFLGAAFSFISSIFSTTDTLVERGEVVVNREFIDGKLEWLVSQAASVTAPPAGSSSTQLELKERQGNIDPAVLSLSTGELLLSLGGEPAAPITNNRIKVTKFEVEHFSSSEATSTLKISLSLQSEIFPYLVSVETLFYVLR
ncbi:MAG: prepilin-type N-terminal cleavage/methylation domain-containing protein [Patescibacteria group bacterium]|nr:prepilin-type N-terminal cleavage/methylation domain-containing protein [Patescibacteria group bacterium]